MLAKIQKNLCNSKNHIQIYEYSCTNQAASVLPQNTLRRVWHPCHTHATCHDRILPHISKTPPQPEQNSAATGDTLHTIKNALTNTLADTLEDTLEDTLADRLKKAGICQSLSR